MPSIETVAQAASSNVMKDPEQSLQEPRPLPGPYPLADAVFWSISNNFRTVKQIILEQIISAQ
jgi:hypothetical protein